jgi:glycosyltransferase involved in cell wall biosynthesis
MTGRVALVHDYLVHIRGGERVFQVMAGLYPQADLFSFVFDEAGMGEFGRRLRARRLQTSFISLLPAPSRLFRAYLPLYPIAVECLDLSAYDLILSSSSAWAHGVRKRTDALHVSYCHSPFRYAWSEYWNADTPRGASAWLMRPLMRLLRMWDVRASRGVDAYMANSAATQQRIARCYGRSSTVVHPPVELDRFHVSKADAGFFLVVSALVRYKRVDVAIEAFNSLKLPLKIVGTGPELDHLQSMAGPTVEFLGGRSDAEVARLYSECRALIFTPDEDFGIVPLEAMASGKPVIAYGSGGALETVVEGVTGRFFPRQTPESLEQAVLDFSPRAFDPWRVRAHAERFGVAEFAGRLSACIARARDARGLAVVRDRPLQPIGQPDHRLPTQLAADAVNTGDESGRIARAHAAIHELRT